MPVLRAAERPRYHADKEQHEADEHRRKVGSEIRYAKLHPETNDQTDADEQNGQESDAAKTRNGRIVHLTLVGHIEQPLAMAQNQYSRYEQPAQGCRQQK